MPRTARIKGPECTYHIIVRGNNKENIFRCDEDKVRFLKTIKKFKIKYNFLLYAYVLMDNHIHMIINSNGEDISKIMQSINISYTYYFNHRYNRIGHLFQDRFKSILVLDDEYLVYLSKYIHNNPKRACIVPEANDYIWSSCRIYTSSTKNSFEIVDKELILGYFSNDEGLAKTKYLMEVNEAECEPETFMPGFKNNPVNVIEKAVNKGHSIKKMDINLILSNISTIYNLPVDDIFLRNNKKHAKIRQECLYIVRLKSRESIKNIARTFGGISCSAVSYGISKAIDRMIEDNGTLSRISQILDSIA